MGHSYTRIWTVCYSENYLGKSVSSCWECENCWKVSFYLSKPWVLVNQVVLERGFNNEANQIYNPNHGCWHVQVLYFVMIIEGLVIAVKYSSIFSKNRESKIQLSLCSAGLMGWNTNTHLFLCSNSDLNVSVEQWIQEISLSSLFSDWLFISSKMKWK